MDLYADLRGSDEEVPLINGHQGDGELLLSIHSLPVNWQDQNTAIFQSSVFIEDGINYRSIHHKIDPWSLKLYRIYYSWYIQWAVRVVIFFNLILAFFEYPTSLSLSSVDFSPNSTLWYVGEPPCGVTESIEIVCLLVFLIDCMVQFRFLGWRRFVKKPWLVLYAVMIVVSFVDLIVSLSFCPTPSHLEYTLGYTIRIRRFFRPLFFLLSSSIMKKYTKAIKFTLPQIFTVLLLLLLHIYVFAMFGMLVFPRPPISHPSSSDNGSLTEGMQNVTNSTEQINKDETYYEHLEGKKYFQTVTDALVHLLVLLTTANHPDIRMPIYQHNRFSSIFFILFLLIGCYFILNLLIAVVYNQFKGFFQKSLQSSFFRRRVAFRAAFTILARNMLKNQQTASVRSRGKEVVSKKLIRGILQKAKISQKQKPQLYHKMETMDPECLNWKQFCEVFDLVSKDPHKKRMEVEPFFYSNVFLRYLQFVIRHRFFAYFMYGVSILHVLLVTIEFQINYSTALSKLDSRLGWYNFVFIFYYAVEQILKLIGFGKRVYFYKLGNLYEGFFTAVLVILELLLVIMYLSPFTTQNPLGASLQHYDTIIRIINICIVLRLLRVVPQVKSFSLLMGTIVDLVKNLRGFAGIIVIVYYLFALLGMELFADVGPAVNPNVTLQCGTYENLTYYANNFHDFASSLVVLWDVMVVNNWYVYLEKFSRDSFLQDWSQLYFIAWWLVSVVICLNLFVSLVLETFLTKWEARRVHQAERSQDDEERFGDSGMWETSSVQEVHSNYNCLWWSKGLTVFNFTHKFTNSGDYVNERTTSVMCHNLCYQ